MYLKLFVIFVLSSMLASCGSTRWTGGSKLEFSDVSLKDGNWAAFQTVVRNRDGIYVLGFKYGMGYPDITIKRWKIR